jgi:ribose transport system ATP-binding protein
VKLEIKQVQFFKGWDMDSVVKTEAPILEMRDITKRFPGVLALENVNFTCMPGEVHALVGENGAGKSTLMKILTGAYRADQGQLLVRGQEVAFRHPQEAQNFGISIIYQEFNLLPYRSIAHNIFLGREPRKGLMVDENLMVQQTAEILDELGVDISPTELVANLRIAQQQEVEIAKALSLNADILIMDEPTAALSLHEVDNLLELVKKLKARGVTIVYITHRMEEIFKVTDRVTVLKDGQFVTSCNTADVTRTEVVELMVGREFSTYFPPKAKVEDIGEVMLDVKNLQSRGSLHDISFQVRKGEIVGFAGLEGCGRTFMARALFGEERIDSGTVILHNQPVRIRNAREAIAAGIGFITEDRKSEGLVLPLSIHWNTALPSLDLRQQFGFIHRKDEAALVENLAESLDLRAASTKQEVQYLSGGNQQKVVLAKWLSTNAKLLIFDEPTRGIDVGAKAGIHKLMRQLASEGVGIIMISSELPEVIGMSDRILVMHEGAITAEFTNNEAVTENMIMQAATGTTVEEEAGN